ncbi:MAG: 50S ribosomal protein L21 [Candidatus Eremiobacteraeota bacterium]|nr:50S ribosomal protein L21 [Candidatus Eremiobacteraeota bacterium]
MYAIVETGGKQYKVSPKDTFNVEKIEGKKGDEIILANVLFVDVMGEKKIGTPYVSGARVKVRILEQDKAKKIIVLKYKPKKKYRVKTGHRQPYTKLLVEEIISA